MPPHLNISELPDTERPRERMRALGPAALSNTELLALLLRHGTRGKSALEMSAELLRKFDGSLYRLANAPADSLSEISGIGGTKSMEMQAVFELARRLAREQLEKLPLCSNPLLIARYMATRFSHGGQEEFHVLLLDSKLQLIRDEIISLGLIDRCPIHPREVYRPAIREGCTSIAVCHNHPSGDPTPSPQDREATRQLDEAGKILGIRLTDHIIVGSGPDNDLRYYSFKQQHDTIRDV